MRATEGDRFISSAIRNHTEQRWQSNDAIVMATQDFLSQGGFKVADSFAKLVSMGQLMVIPGLDIPHAGGMGIYLPKGYAQYNSAETLIHEIFAKCGLSHEECLAMERIYHKRLSGQELDDLEQASLGKAKSLDFTNRWSDVLNIDYYKDGFQVEAATLAGRDRSWYLGIDSSTQSVKFILIEKTGDSRRVIWTHKESFDDPYYMDTFNAPGGVLMHPHAPEQFHTDPLMLADALERCMASLSKEFRANGLSLKNLKAISGAGQQHGTVYFNKRAADFFFEEIDGRSEAPLWMQMQDGGIFANPQSPIWQDAKTGPQVSRIHEAAGGEEKVREMTGSKATLRFGLAQVMAIWDYFRSAFRGTEKILNIAAYNGSLLTGNPEFPWDPGDALGSNMADARKKAWWAEFIDRLVPGLSQKLPPIEASDEKVGHLSPYWLKKYGFSEDTEVINFTGDNPSGLTGMGVIKEGEIVVSLGTSYTMYTFVPNAGLDRALETPIGHIFGEPTGQYMNLVCFQNGDKTLDALREKYIPEAEVIARLVLQAGGKLTTDSDTLKEMIKQMRIQIFTEELARTEPGNDGAMMVAMHKTEDVVRIPFVEGKTYARNLDQANRAQVFRAAVEGQVYFMKWIADRIGLNVSSIKLTGG